MKIVGLITEYNPFHNGHLYHIEEAKRATGADAVLVVMSGDFVQRGAPAILPKYPRAKAALPYVDALFELPVCFSCASAEDFAAGAVALLDSLGCVDEICFGSETGNIAPLKAIAEVLSEEPEAYRSTLQNSLKKGLSYPAARSAALKAYFAQTDVPYSDEELNEILSGPNNILGIEYLKALYRLKSPMKATAIPRIKAGHHDLSPEESFASASALRAAYTSMDGANACAPYVPKRSGQILAEAYGTYGPVTEDDFSLLLKAQLLKESGDSLRQVLDISPELADRMLKERNHFQSFTQFCQQLKTKSLTYTRISRALIHLLLGIKQSDMEAYKEAGYCTYARLLGFRPESEAVLKQVKANAKVPLITKLTRQEALSDTGLAMLDQNIFASNLYESVVSDKFGTPFIHELEQQIVKG